MKFFSYLIFPLLLLTNSYSKGSSFINYFGDTTETNYGHSVIQFPSGSIFFSSYSENNSANFGQIILTKFNQQGIELFTRYFGDSLHHYVSNRMVRDQNKNLIISGSRINSSGLYQPYALKTDSNGIVIWQKEFPAGLNSQFNGVCVFPNNDIGFSGFETDTINSGLNILCVRTNENGDIKFQISVGEPIITETSDNCISQNNNVMLACGDKLAQPGIFNPYVIAVDSNGILIWDLGVNNVHNCGSKNLFIDSNNDLLVVGESSTDSTMQFDILLSKIDLQNQLVKWSRIIVGSNESDAGFAVTENASGNYLITGYGFDTTTSKKRIVLIECDSASVEISKKYYGYSPINIGYEIQNSIDGGIFIAGTDFTNGKNILIYEDSFSNGVQNIIKIPSKIFPNPVRNGDILFSQQNFSEVQIFDLKGKTIVHLKKESNNHFELPSLSKGTFVINLKNNNVNITTELIIIE